MLEGRGGLLSEESERAKGAEGTAPEEAYDALVAKLERVVGELEAGGLSLEQSIERFAEGMRLAREASRRLDQAERRVEMLVKSADGTDAVVPFTPDDRKT